MKCQRCGSDRVTSVCAKVRDACSYRAGGHDRDSYVPDDMGICKGDSDYMEFEWCLECGQIKGTFPLPLTLVERDLFEGETEEEAEKRRADSRPSSGRSIVTPDGNILDSTDLTPDCDPGLFMPFDIPEGVEDAPLLLPTDRKPNSDKKFTIPWKKSR